VKIQYLGAPGKLPVHIQGGGLQTKRLSLAIGSAQARSAILFAAFTGKTDLEISYPVLSRDHTERLFSYLGISIERSSNGELKFIYSEPRMQSSYTVPGDPSAAAYVAAAHVFQRKRSSLQLTNICVNPTRMGFFRLLERCGVPINYSAVCEMYGEPVGTVIVDGRWTKLHPFRIDSPSEFHSLIDEAPLAMAFAAMIPGKSIIANAGELSFKETNRLCTTRDMLAAFNVDVNVTSDSICVAGGKRLRPCKAPSFGDHRIAMTAAALGCAIEGRTTVEAGHCITTSFPRFAETMRAYGFNVHVNEG
jgi:3-phosphoshikimate 1-carboxyvinyltransferase